MRVVIVKQGAVENYADILSQRFLAEKRLELVEAQIREIKADIRREKKKLAKLEKEEFVI